MLACLRCHYPYIPVCASCFQNFEDYLERMSADGTWGDNLTLQVHPPFRPPPMTTPFSSLRGVLMQGSGVDLKIRFGEK
jgi:hypothetical protein